MSGLVRLRVSGPSAAGDSVCDSVCDIVYDADGVAVAGLPFTRATSEERMVCVESGGEPFEAFSRFRHFKKSALSSS
jgi:hypothetical protein